MMTLVAVVAIVVTGLVCRFFIRGVLWGGDENYEPDGPMFYGADGEPLARPVRPRRDPIDELADEMGWQDVPTYARNQAVYDWLRREYRDSAGRN